MFGHATASAAAVTSSANWTRKRTFARPSSTRVIAMPGPVMVK